MNFKKVIKLANSQQKNEIGSGWQQDHKLKDVNWRWEVSREWKTIGGFFHLESTGSQREQKWKWLLLDGSYKILSSSVCNLKLMLLLVNGYGFFIGILVFLGKGWTWTTSWWWRWYGRPLLIKKVGWGIFTCQCLRCS